jgi:hypothetical protein
VDVEVVPTPAILAGKDLSKPIDAATLAAIRQRPEVIAAAPRMALRGPASATAAVAGQDVRFEVGGFADGVEVAALADDPALRARFVDLDPAAGAGPACGDAAPCADLAGQYCDAGDGRCRPRVPVIVSPTLLAMYNTQFAPSHDLPLVEPATFELVSRRKPLTFDIALGWSMNAGVDTVAVQEIGAVVVGVSPRARDVGLTVPMGHVRAWNRALGKDDAGYSAVDVRLRRAAAVEGFGRWLDEQGLTAGPAVVVASPARP